MVVGIFVLVGILCVGYLAIKLGKMEFIGGNAYPVYARFQSVSGLKEGAKVEIAGVNVGKVDTISLDPEIQIAKIKMMINQDVKLADDTMASVKTSGLIGDKYIKLRPGGSDFTIEPGGTIAETESALDIEELVSKYVFGNK